MADLLKVVVTGASGRMGQTLVNLITKSEKLELVGALERLNHEWVGQDIGVAMGGSELGVVVSEDPIEVIANAEAVIDFTTPSATIEFSKLAAQARAIHIIGTTGMSEEDLEKIKAASFHSVVVRAGNMSLGVNLLVALTKKVAAALDDEFDIVFEASQNIDITTSGYGTNAFSLYITTNCNAPASYSSDYNGSNNYMLTTYQN